MKRYFLNLFVFIYFSLFCTLAQADVYLLAKPIVNHTRLPLGATVLGAMMLVPTAIDNSVYYLATDDAITSSIMFGYCAIYRLPEFSAVSRLANEAAETIKGRADLKKAACSDGTKKLKVLKTRYGQQLLLTSSQVNSSSFVFAEMEEGKVPAPVDGVEWIKIENLDEAKLSLQLNLGTTNIASPTTIELPLKDLFEDGATMEWEKTKEWRAAVAKWNKTRGFFDKNLTGATLDTLNVSSSLVLSDGTQIALGEYTHGRGATNMLGLGLYQRMLSLFKSVVDNSGDRTLKLKNHEVIKEAGCKTWYGQITGSKILVK